MDDELGIFGAVNSSLLVCPGSANDELGMIDLLMPVGQPKLDTIGTRSWVVRDRRSLSSMLQDVAESSSGGGVLLRGLGFPVTFVCLSQPSLPSNFRHHLAQAVH